LALAKLPPTKSALQRFRSHLTVGQATRPAREAEVGELWLNHQSNPYPKGAVEAEARTQFGNVRVAADFDRVKVG
jgi:ribonuclease BN (tRNA processing enzyme)